MPSSGCDCVAGCPYFVIREQAGIDSARHKVDPGLPPDDRCRVRKCEGRHFEFLQPIVNNLPAAFASACAVWIIFICASNWRAAPIIDTKASTGFTFEPSRAPS